MEVIRFENDSLLINSGVVSDLYMMDSYNKLTTRPIVECSDIIFYKKVYLVFHSKEEYDNNLEIGHHNQGYNVRYIRFDVDNVLDSQYVLLFIHNNTTKMKVWINDEYIAYMDGWFERAIVFLKKGMNSFCFEVLNKDYKKDLIITLSNPKKEIVSKDLIFTDEMRDVKKYYILFNNNYPNKDGDIEFTVLTNNKQNKKDCVYCQALNKNLYDDKGEDFILLESFSIKTNQIIKYNINHLKNINPKLDNIILYVDGEGEDSFNEDKGCLVRFYFEKNIMNPLNKLINYVRLQVDERKNQWQYVHIKMYYEYIVNKKYDDNTMYYLYTILLDYIKTIMPFKTKEDYLLSYGIKDVIIKSELDDKLTRFALYVPMNINDIKKLPVIMVIASTETKAYIKDYKEMYPEGYLIIECSARGRNFGNYIGNSSVLEVYNYIKKYYPIDTNRIYLFGHSSSATTTTTLISRYPNMFAGGLAIAGLIDKSIIMNCRNNLIISICGDLDRNVDKNYYEKNDLLKKLPISHNILISNMNNASIAVFMRNKSLIDYVLKCELSNAYSFSYTTNNLYYNGYNGVYILEREFSEESASFECDINNNYIEIQTFNIKKMLIKNMALKTLYIYKGESIIGELLIEENELIVSINNNFICTINPDKYDLRNHNSEILNVFLGSMKIFTKSIKDNSRIVETLKNPKSLVENSSEVLVSYPVFESETIDFKQLDKQNNILINYDPKEYFNNTNYYCNYIECSNDGFSYMGKFYEGKYSILQVFPNIYNFNYFNLFINWNDNDYTRKNLFLRYFVIPSDYSLSESVLKKYALIYYNNQYYYISNDGSNIEMYIKK